MLSLYLDWVDRLELHTRSLEEMAEVADRRNLETGLAMSEVLLRLWWPWTF